MWKFSRKIDTIINLSLIAVGTLTLATVFRGCAGKTERNYLGIGQKTNRLFNINQSQKDKSLIIILDANDSEISQNMPFYKHLTQNLKDSVTSQIKAFFTNDANITERFLKNQNWSVENQSNIDLLEYEISSAPTLIITNTDGIIEKMYDGIISSSQQFEIKRMLLLPTEEVKRIPPLNIVKPTEIYQKDNPLREIHLPKRIEENYSGAKYQSLSFKQIGDFGIDKTENAYVIYQEHILKIDKIGNIVKKTKLNAEFNGGFAVDSSGYSYFFLKSRKILILNDLLENYRLLDLEDSLAPEEVCVRMSFGADEGNLFFQTYNTLNTKQNLYQLNVNSKDIELIYSIDKSPYTIPSFGPGMFDWAIDKKRFFISDIFNYQIDVFSLKDKTKIKSINEKARQIPINPTDSELKSLGLDLPHILKPNAMVIYPAIWSIRITPTGKLIVFSGERNSEFQQIIYIYDQNLNKIGTDYKYFRPFKNNFVFSDKLVYSADCSPESESSVLDLSPLDIPKIPIKISVFQSRLEK